MGTEDQRNSWNIGPEEQWEQRTSGYRGPVGTEDQKNSWNRGPEGRWEQRTSGYRGPEEQWNQRTREKVGTEDMKAPDRTVLEDTQNC